MAPNSGDSNISDGDFVHAPFSLPHGFRFSGTHGESFSRIRSGEFFVRSPAADDVAPVPAVDSAAAKTRLEVLHAWEVNFTIVSLYCVSALALLYVFFALAHVRTVWYSTHVIAPAGIIERTFAPVLRIAAPVLAILFVLRVVAHGQATHEQLWTGALLTMSIICTNPLILVAERKCDGESRHHAALIINDAVYTAASYLYLLLTVHSYRILDNKMLHSRALYAKKLAVIVFYFFLKLITGFGAHVVLGLVPFARILAWIILLRSGRSSARVTIPVLLTTALDALLVIWLFREVALTAQFLARTPYLEHRAKQLGFRCFVYQSLVFCVSIVVLANVATLRLPREILFRNFDDAASSAFLQIETPAGHLGLAFVYFTWTVVLAFVNLPPGPVLPYTGRAVFEFFDAMASSAPVVWLRARGIPLPIRNPDNYDSIPDTENPPHVEPAALSSPFVPGDTIPLRYRHRELFVTLEEHRESPTFSPFPLAVTEAARNSYFEQRRLKEIKMEEKNIVNYQNEVSVPPIHTGKGGKDHGKEKSRARIDEEENWDNFSLGFFSIPDYRPSSAASTGYVEEEDEMSEGADVGDPEELVEQNGTDEANNTGLVNPPNRGLAIPVPVRPLASTSGLGSYHGGSDSGITLARLPSQFPDRATRFARDIQQPLGSQESIPGLPLSVPRLHLRKNLFVMETQVFLAQTAYLAYIPGNSLEERNVAMGAVTKLKSPQARKTLQHTASLSTDLKGLARRFDEPVEKVADCDVNTTESQIVSPHYTGAFMPEAQELDEEADPNRQPNFDDGTKFRVDPEQIARDNGYTIFRQISNLEINLHATVLLGKDRVVVAFSGTRDARNWITNTQLRRCAFDDLFPEFEYEIAPKSSRKLNGGHYPTLIVTPIQSEKNSEEPKKYRGRQKQEMRVTRPSSSCRDGKLGSLRKSQSTDSLLHQSQHSWERGTESSGDLGSPAARGLTFYGSSGHPKARLSTREQEHGSESGKLRRSPTQRVQFVASTIAQEFMTIGQAKVHDGFANAYLLLRKHVLGALVELYGGDTGANCDDNPAPPLAHSLPLFLCGHSLGGALATFASFEAAKYFRQIGMQSRQDISCTTFGCPMVGNDVFKARYERVVETHWRFEMASDPVPKLPSGFLNYTHVGVRVLLDQSGMLLIDPSFIEVHWWGKLSNPYLGYKLHIRASYITALRLYCFLYKNGEDKLEDAFWPFPIKVQTKGVFLMSTTK